MIGSTKYLSPYYPEQYPIELCVEQWVANNKIIEEDTKDIECVMRISYENLTDNLKETISAVLQWLPVKNKNVPKLNTFKFHGIEKPIKNMNNESIGSLSDQDIEKINQIAKTYLEKWGYQILGSGESS